MLWKLTIGTAYVDNGIAFVFYLLEKRTFDFGNFHQYPLAVLSLPDYSPMTDKQSVIEVVNEFTRDSPVMIIDQTIR